MASRRGGASRSPDSGVRPVAPGLPAGGCTPTIAATNPQAIMSQPETPAPKPDPSRPGLSREQKMQLLHDELKALNAQLEFLRLMIKLRRPQP